MLSPQSQVKSFFKPSSIPKLSKSSTSPKLSEGSGSPAKSSMSKSTFIFLSRHLNEISKSLAMLEEKFPLLEASEILKICVKSLTIVKEKISEFALDDATRLSQGNKDEYCLFLEYLLSYEQSRTDIIIQKSKFPKLRMKEVEKILAEDYPCKFVPVKPGEVDVSLADRLKNEAKELLRSSKKLLKDKTKIPEEVEELLETSIREISSVSSIEPASYLDPLSYLEESPQLERKRNQDLYESLTADHQKLSEKYSYIMNRFDKLDHKFRFQTNTLNLLSTLLSQLKSQYIAFSADIFSMISVLITKFSSQIFSNPKNNEKKLEEKCEKLEKTVSELQQKLRAFGEEKNSDSDSLDLQTDLSGMIEIEALREQIRVLNYKIYESSNSHKKEIESYKSTVSKLLSQAFSQDGRIKELSQKLQDMFQEKENLIDEISRFHKTSAETIRSPELVYSVEKSHVKTADILNCLSDDIEKIAGILKSSHLFEQHHDNNLNLIKKAVEFLVSLKEDIQEDSRYFEGTLEAIVRDRNSKAFSIDRDLCTESYLKDMQVEMYKTKLKDKKHQMEQIKQQNEFLKKGVKDLQVELKRVRNEDNDCVKKIFVNIAEEIPLMRAEFEQMILVFMKGIGLSSKEIKGVANRRKAKLIGFFK